MTEPGVREKGIRLSSTKVLTDYSSRNRVVPAPRDSTGKTRRELVGIILYPHTPLHLTEPAAPGAINSRSRVCVNVFQTSQLFNIMSLKHPTKSRVARIRAPNTAPARDLVRNSTN